MSTAISTAAGQAASGTATTTDRVRTFGRRIAGARKELSRGHSRAGAAFVMLYPHARRIEVSWGDGADHTGISLSFTREQAVQLAAEIHDLLDLLDEVDPHKANARATQNAEGR